jgi:two-component system invasion response regulator UvrY
LITVVLVDDHSLVRVGIRHLLEDTVDIQVVGEAENGTQALSIVNELRPNVVLLDIIMPGLSGIELLKKLLIIDSHLKILIITSCDNKVFPSRLLEAGAVGYFLKKVGIEELIKTIRKIYNGQLYMSSELATQLALAKRKPSKKTLLSALSKREYEVMQLLIKGCSVQEVADQLKLKYKTVSTLRYRTFEKLKVKNDVELIQFAIRMGILVMDKVH